MEQNYLVGLVKKRFKFAHLADMHIGGWRDPLLKDLSTKAFSIAVERCLTEKVDFVLIAGDLFNTSLPPMDNLKAVVQKLKLLKDNDVPVYAIAGSHDFSPTGKTMLDVLESAGLMVNVAKAEISGETNQERMNNNTAIDNNYKTNNAEVDNNYKTNDTHNNPNRLRLKITIDPKTGVKIAGMVGRKGGLEKEYYSALDVSNLEKEDGYKIFMFHTAISEMKPEETSLMETQPLSLLPKGFDYYAGGHVHIVKSVSLPGYKKVVYPGPLFPNSFSELEKLKQGGFYIIEAGSEEDKYTFVPLQIHHILSFTCDANHLTPIQVEEKVKSFAGNVNGAIVTLRVEGTLESGKPSEIRWNDIISQFNSKGAYTVLRNTAKLESKEYEEVKTSSGDINQIEEKVIYENCGKINIFPVEREREMMKSLLQCMSSEKAEGETAVTYEKRILQEAEEVIFGR